jgi:adenylate cyclase
MPTIRFLPDDVEVQAQSGETVLDASLHAGIAHAHACGGHARCSTCRVEVTEGIDECAPRTIAEQVLADRLGFAAHLRLACQTIANADLTVRRLVLDDDDIELVDQRPRDAAPLMAGEERELAILFADISGFTSFSEALPPHDVVHVLNRFFHAMGRAIAQFGGCIDNYMGDGLMALFGLREAASETVGNAPEQAVRAGLAMLVAMDELKPYLETAYGRSFDMRIGIHYGEAVVGSVGAIGRERVTAIGDAVNLASRIESANKLFGTRLLLSAPAYSQVIHKVDVAATHETGLPGKTGVHRLYEVVGLHSPA